MENTIVTPREVIDEHLTPIALQLRQAAETLGSDHCFVALVDSNNILTVNTDLWIRGARVFAGQMYVSEGLSGWAIRKDSAVIYPRDAGSSERYHETMPQVRSEIAVPIHYQDRPTGIVLFDRIDSEQEFSEDDRGIAMSVAKSIDKILKTDQDADARLEALAEACRVATNSLRGYIAMKSWDGGLEYVPVGEGKGRFLYLSSTEGLCGRVLQTGKPLNIGNVYSEVGYIPSDVNIQSEIVYPIQVGDMTVGVVNMESDRVDAYDQRCEDSLAATAEDAAPLMRFHRSKPDPAYFLAVWDFLESMIFLLNEAATSDDESVQETVLLRLRRSVHLMFRKSSCSFWDHRKDAAPPPPFDQIPNDVIHSHRTNVLGEQLGGVIAAEEEAFVYEPLIMDGDHWGFLGIFLEKQVAHDALAKVHRLASIASNAVKRRRFQVANQILLKKCLGVARTGSLIDVQILVDELPGILDADHCTLFVRDSSGVDAPRFVPGPTTAERFHTEPGLAPYFVEDGVDLVCSVIKNQTACNIRNLSALTHGDTGSTFRWVERLSELEPGKCRSLLAVPLVAKSETVGILRVVRGQDSRRSRFGEFDERVMELCARLSAPLVAADI